ncbi:FmdB family zinc ribbon protein [Acidobacteriota bacterium]
MPLYEYRCLKCGSVFEVLQKMNAPPQIKCLKCGGAIEKIISAPAIQFKGSGWYVTDYANKERQKKKPAAEKKEPETKSSPKKKKSPQSSSAN